MKQTCSRIFLVLLFVLEDTVSLSCTSRRRNSSVARRRFVQGALSFPSLAVSSFFGPPSVAAIGAGASTSESGSSDASKFEMVTEPVSSRSVAYKTISLDIPTFGVRVPVACWFPVDESAKPVNSSARLRYKHRISVRRIGELLAGWEFIPEFASRSFDFSPITLAGSFLDGDNLPFPSDPRVIILSHGFLGSRFDLSHLAEELASKGFICVSPEYPESLSASYNRVLGLDRTIVNNELLRYVESTMRPKGYGVVGHSLGCGTALNLGDSSWARVLIAGPPAPEDCASPLLLITSMNDVFVRTRGTAFTVPAIYERLQEGNIPPKIPRSSALIFDRPDAPNHISYLSENVNDAMINFLSPLLPIAQALSIPVLDFDTYQVARDAEPTAAVIKPLITHFFLQHLSPDDSM